MVVPFEGTVFDLVGGTLVSVCVAIRVRVEGGCVAVPVAVRVAVLGGGGVFDTVGVFDAVGEPVGQGLIGAGVL